jgi:glycerol-3-phosphate dehydrogenase (NAD(P)+)
MVVEGVRNTRVARELSLLRGIEMPITEQAYRVLFEQLPTEEAMRILMRRGRKHEREELLRPDRDWPEQSDPINSAT